MNVAPATSTVSWPSPFMTAHGAENAARGAGARTPAQISTSSRNLDGGDAEPLVNRFPTIAFSYDVDASRLVMQYRDPANGKTVSQIPTEAALKQYKEAQQQEKDAARAAHLEVTIGGGPGGKTDPGASGRNGGSPSAKSGASTPHVSSAGSAPVAHFASTATHPAAVSTGAARVNVVI